VKEAAGFLVGQAAQVASKGGATIAANVAKLVALAEVAGSGYAYPRGAFHEVWSRGALTHRRAPRGGEIINF